MSENPIENVEIEPLSDEDLEEVAGGLASQDAELICSRDNCSNG